MRFIFFKGLENVSVCRCVCVHMAVWSSRSAQGEAAGLPWAPGLAAPVLLQAHWPLQHSGNPGHVCLGDFQRGGSSSRLLQLCVWHRSPPRLLKQLWLIAHPGRAPSPSRAPQWPEHHPRHSELRVCWERAFLSWICYRGVKQGAGMRNLCLLFREIISSAHSAAWAGRKVMVHLSLPWAPLRARASWVFPACSDWMCLFRWREQPSLKRKIFKLKSINNISNNLKKGPDTQICVYPTLRKHGGEYIFLESPLQHFNFKSIKWPNLSKNANSIS